jgi:hypothetical protein
MVGKRTDEKKKKMLWSVCKTEEKEEKETKNNIFINDDYCSLLPNLSINQST